MLRRGRLPVAVVVVVAVSVVVVVVAVPLRSVPQPFGSVLIAAPISVALHLFGFAVLDGSRLVAGHSVSPPPRYPMVVDRDIAANEGVVLQRQLSHIHGLQIPVILPIGGETHFEEHLSEFAAQLFVIGPLFVAQGPGIADELGEDARISFA